MMTCESCHSRILESRQTAEVNLPGIETCRRCHKEAGAMQAAAEGRCYECHSYHDWRKEQPLKGKFDLNALRAGN
jgi:DNA-directed RNA polymerase subunit RPC12/RpoP